MNILDKLTLSAEERVAAAKKIRPLKEIKAAALSLPPKNAAASFAAAIGGPDLAFICECKRASPSKGLIAPDFPYLTIAKEYEAAGAEAISVLTEPTYFLGRDEYLSEIASAVKIPCLRKDFVTDEYQLYEAKLLGAAAALLIVRILEPKKLAEYINICAELGLSALTETHTAEEIDLALKAGASIIGVNNRNLGDFSIDLGLSKDLRRLVPPDTLFVMESGISSPSDVQAARNMGANAVLVGEALMRAPDKRAKLRTLRG